MLVDGHHDEGHENSLLECGYTIRLLEDEG